MEAISQFGGFVSGECKRESTADNNCLTIRHNQARASLLVLVAHYQLHTAILSRGKVARRATESRDKVADVTSV